MLFLSLFRYCFEIHNVETATFQITSTRMVCQVNAGKIYARKHL